MTPRRESALAIVKSLAKLKTARGMFRKVVIDDGLMPYRLHLRAKRFLKSRKVKP